MKKIFILHGWTYSADKWQELVTCLKKSGFEPVLLDIPGLTAKTDKVWSLNDFSEWLNDQLGPAKEKAILVGHSNGGRIAVAFAAKYPHKLKNLILIDSAGVYHQELAIRFKRFVFAKIAKWGKKITASEKLQSLLYKLAGESDYQNANPLMKQTMLNLIAVDLKPDLRKINTPTLIIWGRQDKITPLCDGKLIHSLVKNSKLIVLSNAGHSPQFTHIELVCQKIAFEINKL